MKHKGSLATESWWGGKQKPALWEHPLLEQIVNWPSFKSRSWRRLSGEAKTRGLNNLSYQFRSWWGGGGDFNQAGSILYSSNFYLTKHTCKSLMKTPFIPQQIVRHQLYTRHCAGHSWVHNGKGKQAWWFPWQALLNNLA